MDPEDPKRYNEPEMIESSEFIIDIIKQEAKTYYDNDYSRIFLGGFSQGCALTYLIGLTFQEILGGLIGFSGIVAPLFHSMLKADENMEKFKISLKAEKLPVFHYHGK